MFAWRSAPSSFQYRCPSRAVPSVNKQKSSASGRVNAPRTSAMPKKNSTTTAMAADSSGTGAPVVFIYATVPGKFVSFCHPVIRNSVMRSTRPRRISASLLSSRLSIMAGSLSFGCSVTRAPSTRSGRRHRRALATLAAEVGNGEHQRRGLERGAEVERRAYAPVALWKVRHHGQDRRAYRRSDHRHQAVQSTDRSQCLALVALVGGAGDDALDRHRDRGAEQVDENDREHHPALGGGAPQHVGER